VRAARDKAVMRSETMGYESIEFCALGDGASAFRPGEVEISGPGEGEVEIAVAAFGVNFAEVMARRGLYQDAPARPCVLGYEVAGRVAAVGTGVTGLSVGQRVAALTRFGGYARRAVARIEAVVPLPDDVSDVAAAALPVQGATAVWSAEEATRLRPGDRVLVHAAAGGVGRLLVSLALKAGADVVGSSGSRSKLGLIEAAGATAILHRDGDAAALTQEAGPGFDVIFDSLGGASTRLGYRLLRAGGRLVCLGGGTMARGGWSRLAALPSMVSFGLYHPVPMMMESKAIIGVNMLRLADQRPDVLQRCLARTFELAASGIFAPAITAFEASAIGRAHDDLEQRRIAGKLVGVWPTSG
jgi:NADPH2:quinone reductase